MANRLEPDGLGFRLPAESAPTPEQRAWFARRLTEVEAYRRPISGEEIASEIAGLTGALAVRNGDEITKKVLFALYEEALAGLPYVDACAVCRAYRQGELGDRTWAPNPPTLRQAVINRARLWRDEIEKINRVLSARIFAPLDKSAEDRTAFVEREMQRFHESFAEKMKYMPERLRPLKGEVLRPGMTLEQEKAAAERWLLEAAKEKLPPLHLSPEALSTLRIEQQKEVV